MRITLPIELEEEIWNRLQTVALKHYISLDELAQILVDCHLVDKKPLCVNDPDFETRLSEKISEMQKRFEF